MTIKTLSLTVFFVALSRFCAIGEIYTVNAEDLPNQGDPSVEGSIAYYLDRAASNDVVVLTEPGDYLIKTSLTVPSGVALKGGGSSTWLRCDASLDNGTMIYLENNSTLKDLQVDASRFACECVNAEGTIGVTVDGGVYQNTKNEYPDSTNHCNYGAMWFKYTSHATLKNFRLSSVACNPKLNSAGWAYAIRGVYAIRSVDCICSNLAIDHILSGGIDITSAVGSRIYDCTIRYTGQGRLYSTSPDSYKVWGAQDAIVGYHGGPENNTLIKHCVIDNYMNHGIHISGHNIEISDNKITNPHPNGGLDAIYVGDWRTPQRLSSDITLSNNILEWGINHVDWNLSKPMDKTHAPIRFQNVCMDTVDLGSCEPNQVVSSSQVRILETTGDVNLVDERSHAFVCEFNGTQDSVSTENIGNLSVDRNSFGGVSLTDNPQVIRTGIIAGRTKTRSDLLLAADYSRVVVRMKVESGCSGTVRVFWKTDTDPGFDESRSVTATTDIVDSDIYHEYIFDVGRHPEWSGAIDGIRVDPVAVSGKEFSIDYIRLQE